MWGLDLEYGEDAFKMATEGKDDFDPPKFIGIIDVFYPNQAPTEPPILPAFWKELE